MSSPFHTLKKNKVPLFPGHMTGNRPIPFRHPEYSEDECRLLEEVTSGMVQERKKRDPFMGLPQLNSSPKKSLLRKQPDLSSAASTERKDETKLSPSDHDLMRLMMSKIAILENKVHTQESELRTKDRQMKVLEDKLRIAEKARKENINPADIKDLETYCLLLQQQVHEMETFLAEYGMVWVGESTNERSDVYLEDDADNDAGGDEENNNLTEISAHSDFGGDSMASSNLFSVWHQDASLPVSAAPINVDFNQLVDNIKDLNILAGEGVSQIKITADGARFQVPDPVQLTIYANGILMFGGPFRPYSNSATLQCVQDLLDGYFPSELQGRYPDGVPFALTDLRDTYFLPKQSPLVFAGEGQPLGGEVRTSRLIPTNLMDITEMNQLPTQCPGVQTSTGDRSPGTLATTSKLPVQPVTGTLATTSKLPVQPMTQAQFLQKLPKVVVKDGKVIDIRDSIGQALSGNDSGINTPKQSVTLINTRVTKEMTESVAASGSETERPRSYKGHGDVTTLRVMTENGDHTYIVKMKFKETVGDLRSYLDTHRRPTVPYEIVSTFPHKVHKNNTLTLEASGLTPNAVLHLKPHK